MYEFRGATLQDAVHRALRYPALSTKKLAKVAAKFDFSTRIRMGSVLFVGEGNLSFALTMSRKPRVPVSSILATVYEAEEDLTDTAYDNLHFRSQRLPRVYLPKYGQRGVRRRWLHRLRNFRFFRMSGQTG